MLESFVKAILFRCGTFKKVKKLVYLGEMKIHLHSANCSHILAHVSTSSRIKCHEMGQKPARDILLRRKVWQHINMDHPAALLTWTELQNIITNTYIKHFILPLGENVIFWHDIYMV